MRLLVVLIVGLLGMAPPVLADGAGRVTVVGTGSYAAAPDMARVSLGVVTKRRTAADALAANNAAMRAVLDTLKAGGIERRDIQTVGLSLQPVWANRGSGNREIVGYTARNSVTARVRDLAALGTLLDAVVGRGGNELLGVSFGLQDDSAALDKARQLAVNDAMHRAALYARAAGVSLGPVVEISEAGGGGPMAPVMREMSVAAGVPLESGEVAVRASVTMVFAIGE